MSSPAPFILEGSNCEREITVDGDTVRDAFDLAEPDFNSLDTINAVLNAGTAEAREIEKEESDDERSITARIESKANTEQEQSLTLLGVAIQVTSNTEFDDSSFCALESGDRVDVDYTVDSDGNRLATQIENEGDQPPLARLGGPTR